MSAPSATLQQVILDLTEREQVGTAKYGTTCDRSDLSASAWARHAHEEALDQAMYTARLLGVVRGLEERNQSLEAENARLRGMLAPILELARTLEVGSPAPVAAPDPAPSPAPLPAPVSSPSGLPVGAPEGMLSSAQFCRAVGIAQSTLSGYVKAGAIAPVGHHLSRGMKTAHYSPEQVQPLVAAMAAKAAARPSPPVGVAYTKDRLPSELVTSKQAAAMLDVTTGALSKAIKAGALKVHTPGGGGKLAIFERSEIVRYMQVRDASRQANTQRLKQQNDVARAAKASAPAQAPTPKDEEIEEPAPATPEPPIATPEPVPAAPAPKLDPNAVARAIAAREALSKAPKPTPASDFDINEAGRIEAEGYGKTAFRGQKGFRLWRVVHPGRYEWLALAPGQDAEVGEMVEAWTLNGLGQWESAPALPGGVGSGSRVSPSGPIVARIAA